MSEQAPTMESDNQTKADIRTEAEKMVQEHNDNVSSRDSAEMDAVKAEDKADAMTEASIHIVDVEGQGALDARNKLREASDRYSVIAEGYKEAAEDYDTHRKATLWEAREHLQDNKEAYEKAAIEDANAAGHDVNFGGEHYPAQNTEKLEKPAA